MDELSFAKQVCAEAGELLLERLNSGRLGRIETKTTMTDLVTAVDREVDDFIVHRIQEQYSDHYILTEEQGWFESGSREHLWILDPIDGTRNFVHGYPLFSISLALLVDGKRTVGVIEVPCLHESYWARAGMGAYRNGKRIHVSSCEQLERSLLATGFACVRASRERNNLPVLERILRLTHDIRRSGSAAFDLCSVACGRVDGFWELELSPWDIAAGMLLVEEAGGRVSDFQGGDNVLFGRQMVATNGKIHDQLLAAIEAAWKERGGVER